MACTSSPSLPCIVNKGANACLERRNLVSARVTGNAAVESRRFSLARRSCASGQKNVIAKRRTPCVRVRAQVAEKPTIDNATVLVVGGGGVGMAVTRDLAKAGSWVTVFQRSEKFRKEVEGLGSMLAIGDVLEPLTVEKAFRSNSFDAVVCTVGGGTQNVKVDQDGTINVINAAKKANVKRFIMVSSIGAGDSEKAIDAKTLATLGEVLKAKTVAEEALKSSGLDYTIIRPGGLNNDAPSGNGILTENSSVVGLISRTDVASLIFRILFDERTYGKTLSAIDSQRLFPPTTSLDGIELLALS
ncbi:uncharacterized protein LOC112345109 isoform X1 [Selaginella moellendorffii]|uniref:uncharacterized protein LOC112345109 isoform X1 n=1 Tax=Selaginella moellendorffii TaxID=88036 RepID=UPI000D1D051C|nr:uncharacterized protein LOC112345109 isoform X1 [Selaginella moellendorffii]|eukprot:XP_024526953.1 uncharacterized protein LOC112345109 isoform X1 [Selaginella moellendorffii]